MAGCDLEIYLSPRQLCDTELICNGGFTPLTGFMTEEEYMSVVENNRLPNGLLFGLPVVYDTDREDLKPGRFAVLRACTCVRTTLSFAACHAEQVHGAAFVYFRCCGLECLGLSEGSSVRYCVEFFVFSCLLCLIAFRTRYTCHVQIYCRHFQLFLPNLDFAGQKIPRFWVRARLRAALALSRHVPNGSRCTIHQGTCCGELASANAFLDVMCLVRVPRAATGLAYVR